VRGVANPARAVSVNRSAKERGMRVRGLAGNKGSEAPSLPRARADHSPALLAS
jgi:hypothetical protein